MEDFNSIDGSIFLRFGYKLEGIFFFFLLGVTISHVLLIFLCYIYNMVV